MPHLYSFFLKGFDVWHSIIAHTETVFRARSYRNIYHPSVLAFRASEVEEMKSMIGQTISHYRIKEKLGEGGMGVVYLAEDTHLGRQVAIKFLASANEQHYRSRFLREARAISTLSHPNIAIVHDYGETEEGQPFIVMEYIKG